MNSGFKNLVVTDPNKLKTFIEGTTGSIVAILNVSTLFSSYKNQLLLSENKSEQLFNK